MCVCLWVGACVCIVRVLTYLVSEAVIFTLLNSLTSKKKKKITLSVCLLIVSKEYICGCCSCVVLSFFTPTKDFHSKAHNPTAQIIFSTFTRSPCTSAELTNILLNDGHGNS